MFCRSVLLTGCSRGLGLEMVRQLVSRVDILIATCRNPDSAEVCTLLISSFVLQSWTNLN